jgi:hypothetical protein
MWALKHFYSLQGNLRLKELGNHWPRWLVHMQDPMTEKNWSQLHPIIFLKGSDNGVFPSFQNTRWWTKSKNPEIPIIFVEASFLKQENKMAVVWLSPV